MDRVSKAERELVRKMQRQTNADRIRAMTDEELAGWLNNQDFICPPVVCQADNCCECWLRWLRQEADT